MYMRNVWGKPLAEANSARQGCAGTIKQIRKKTVWEILSCRPIVRLFMYPHLQPLGSNRGLPTLLLQQRFQLVTVCRNADLGGGVLQQCIKRVKGRRCGGL